jgi:hypothetical protein
VIQKTSRPPAQAAGPHETPRATRFERSLVYSGLAGLVIAAVGLIMIGWRRQSW